MRRLSANLAPTADLAPAEGPDHPAPPDGPIGVRSSTPEDVARQLRSHYQGWAASEALSRACAAVKERDIGTIRFWIAVADALRDDED